MNDFNRQTNEIAAWMRSPRFDGITRLYSARQIAEQRGSIAADYPIARQAAEAFYRRLRELFAERRAITTFGPYTPGQAVAIKRAGIEAIYVGGWATSAKGSIAEDPGSDLASYPLGQVPDECAAIVRALLTADKNQNFNRARMTPEKRDATPIVDYRPFIIADADTGHGGDAHVRNLIRRFVEVGVPGFHIEDQKPGVKKCGHQAGKVLVAEDEQIKRLNAARFQLDVMGVPGIIVARTDAEAATLIDSRSDERDHPFILGVTSADVPSFKTGYLAVMKRIFEKGVTGLRGHLLYKISDREYQAADRWLAQTGVTEFIDSQTAAFAATDRAPVDRLFETVGARYAEIWQAMAGLKTYAQAVAETIAFRLSEGEDVAMSPAAWLEFARTASFFDARETARDMDIEIHWDCELARTPDGYYQIEAGIGYAIAKSLAAAPFADLIWMETKTANLADAREFAEAIHAVYPEKMLAYNLSPSFNWDTTGMSDDDMRRFPEELGKLGYVFNFITYGGHQVDGLASEEFASALRDDGMVALAKLQRRFRLLESPYRTPQTLVGGPRIDAALMAATGHTATTMAMGKASTQHQHLVQTEVPPKVLADWLEAWSAVHKVTGPLKVELRPNSSGSELLELSVLDTHGEKLANVVFESIRDRRGRGILSVRDQNNFSEMLRRKRLMTLCHLFLIHRYQPSYVHYVSPNEQNHKQALRMQDLGIYGNLHSEIGHIIVADVNTARIAMIVDRGRLAMQELIEKAPT